LLGSAGVVSTSNARAAISRRIRSAISNAWSTLVSGSRIANSSPPNRAGTSKWRSCARNTSAIPRSTASPARWPYVLLTSRRRSRSTMISDSGRSNRLARVSSSPSAAAKWRALKRPVFGSTRASSWRSSTASER
jgi:hypothetical protein